MSGIAQLSSGTQHAEYFSGLINVHDASSHTLWLPSTFLILLQFALPLAAYENLYNNKPFSWVIFFLYLFSLDAQYIGMQTQGHLMGLALLKLVVAKVLTRTFTESVWPRGVGKFPILFFFYPFKRDSQI